MSNKRSLLIGTFVLTATGFLSRLIGFFFRMFLSHTFGEEQVGLYQLIFPIYALCFSLSSAGIETSISRSTARKFSTNKKEEALQLLYIGMSISLFLATTTMLLLQVYASKLSIYILGDVRCEPLLIAISYALPFSAVHSCIVGYYLGLKQTKLPAIAQLIEQLARVLTVYIIYLFHKNNNREANILIAVFGILVGELFSSFLCLRVFTSQNRIPRFSKFTPKITLLSKELLQLSIPLTASRILLNILQSVESISIPLRLQQYGYSAYDALSNYGVLTGMALPCILFPSAVTNSISTMLLPTVAEIQAIKDYSKLKDLIRKIFFSCMALGLACCLIFFFLASWIGQTLFHSTLASDYIQTLAWICPFLYLNSTLLSITNGLGNANTSFAINSLGLGIRIVGVLIFIPKIGMNGYLWGLLLSQFVVCALCTMNLIKYIKKRV